MATAESLGIRREAAQARIDAAITLVSAQTGAVIEPMPATSRDAAMDMTLRVEWVAASLEAIASATAKKQSKKVA